MTKKRIFKFFALCAVILLLVSSLAITCFAAEAPEGTNAEIKLTKKISGLTSTKEKFTFVLTANDDSAPMPEESEIIITGAETASFSIHYDEPGVYKYTLKETAGNTERWTYDNQVYTVEVYILRNEKDNTLEPQVIYFDKEGYKTEAVFNNTYTQPEPEPATGDSNELNLWLSLLCISVIGIGAVVFIPRKTEE